MSEPSHLHKKTAEMLVKLVPREEFEAAWESSVAMARFGVRLVVFCDRELMHWWLESVRYIRGLSVRVLKNLEASNA
jgi:hypothetical protein